MGNLWQIILSILQALWLPGLAFFGGVLVMRALSGHAYVTRQWREKAAPRDKKPLNMRPMGYDTDAVARHWAVLDERALQSERRFLQLDLIFPIFYGTTLAVALWQACTAVATTFSPAWPIALVAVTVIADWIENLIQISQLRRFVQHGKDSLQPQQIRIASAATILKLYCFLGAVVLLIILAVRRAVQ